MINQKIEISRLVIELLGVSSPDLDEALRLWYRNIRPRGGLRLTDTGYQAFTLAKIASWSWHPKDPNTLKSNRTQLVLDKKLQWPYYINLKQGSVIFYSGKEAMLVMIYNDVDKFLANYE